MRRRIRHDEETGELNIVPYLDIVTNLVMFMLLSMTGLVSLGVVNVSAPKAAPAGAGADQPKLLLTVAISKAGFFVGGTEPGAPAPKDVAGAAPTIPLAAGGGYDYAALTERMKQVKDRFPNETNLVLTAEPDVPYDVLVQTMDACREAKVPRPGGGPPERRPLFFDVALSLTT